MSTHKTNNSDDDLDVGLGGGGGGIAGSKIKQVPRHRSMSNMKKNSILSDSSKKNQPALQKSAQLPMTMFENQMPQSPISESPISPTSSLTPKRGLTHMLKSKISTSFSRSNSQTSLAKHHPPPPTSENPETSPNEPLHESSEFIFYSDFENENENNHFRINPVIPLPIEATPLTSTRSRMGKGTMGLGFDNSFPLLLDLIEKGDAAGVIRHVKIFYDDVNMVDSNGDSPLHLALKFGLFLF
jgi:hypothetical protein